MKEKTEESKLIIKIYNERPVELLDLAKSMMSMSDEYKRFLAKHEAYADPEHVKLYIKEIRGGSIITELVSLAPYTLPLIDHAQTIVEYAKHIKVLYEWLSSGKEKPEHTEKSTLENLNNIIEPVAKDHGSQMNLGAFTVQGNLIVNVNINSTEANATQNAIRRELDAMKEPVTGIHEGVVMYWAQARNQLDSSKAGDRARIESIYMGDVKVRFKNDELKLKMLYEEPHPFKKAFVVDVAVETVNEKPVLYRILELHDVLDKA